MRRTTLPASEMPDAAFCGGNIFSDPETPDNWGGNGSHPKTSKRIRIGLCTGFRVWAMRTAGQRLCCGHLTCADVSERAELCQEVEKIEPAK